MPRLRSAFRPLLAAVAFALAALLAGCGEDPPAKPETVEGKTQAKWVSALEGGAPAEKVAALGALAQFESPPLEAISGQLEAADAEVRAAAIRALGAFGPDAAKWAPELAIYLEESPEGFDGEQAAAVRNAAMLTLREIGPAAWEHMRHLLVSRDQNHRLRVVWTIRPFVSQIEGASKALMPLMKDEYWKVRLETARTLGEVGKDDDFAAEALMDGLEDENPEVIRASAISLGSVGGSSDVEGRALADKLTAYSAGVRSAAVYSLGMMGEEATPFLKAIGDLMKNDNKRIVRLEAARAYWRIGHEAELPLAVLAEDMRTEKKAMRRFALQAVAEMGPAAAPMVPQLLKMLEDPDVRDLAATVLGTIGPGADAALPRLKALVEEAGSGDPDLAKAVRDAVAAIQAAD